MEINDNIEFFFENELNDNNTYLEEEFSYFSLIQEKDLINKKINLSSNLNYNKSNEEVKKISKNKKQKKPIKLKKYECIKMKNRESAKRYRQRHKMKLILLEKENERLKKELKTIIEYLNIQLCTSCKNLFFIKKKKKRFFVIKKE